MDIARSNSLSGYVLASYSVRCTSVDRFNPSGYNIAHPGGAGAANEENDQR
jgi:hypothetical protein